jgi:transaldolase
MKIFLDTADVEAVRRAHETGLLDGVTTNPSKVAATGRAFREVVAEICGATPGPVSAEAMSPTAPEMIAEAVEIAKIAPNVVVKIPMGVEGLKTVGVLERERDVRVNLTMTFSAAQAFLAMKAGASFVTVVLSRLDAIGGDSGAFVADAVTIKRNYGFSSELIAGSVKTQAHVLACLRAGVDVATLPEGLFFRLFEHALTDAALEQFAADWRKVPK